jgi:hypothetical protein
LILDSEKVLDILASWQLELRHRPDARDIVAYQIVLKVTFFTPPNPKLGHTVALQYLQVFPSTLCMIALV